MMLKEKQDLLHEYQHLIAQLDHLPGVRLSLKRIAAEEDIHLKVLKDLFSRARSAQS